ncbi:MAG: type II secretion system protein GspF, partial [Halieaceae bacterium]|nr:type II secretion system protein GspF [Halieaceae bacterium]
MTAYRYRALNPKGKLVRGVLEGDSERQVRSQLRVQSLRPVEVAVANRAEPASSSGWRIPLLRPGISAGDLALLTR